VGGVPFWVCSVGLLLLSKEYTEHNLRRLTGLKCMSTYTDRTMISSVIFQNS